MPVTLREVDSKYTLVWQKGEVDEITFFCQRLKRADRRRILNTADIQEDDDETRMSLRLGDYRRYLIDPSVTGWRGVVGEDARPVKFQRSTFDALLVQEPQIENWLQVEIAKANGMKVDNEEEEAHAADPSTPSVPTPPAGPKPSPQT